MKIAVPQALFLSPASWTENTTRTDAAMIRMQPMMSSSFTGRRWTSRIWLGLGHATIKRTRGIMPIGALLVSENVGREGSGGLLYPKYPSPSRVVRNGTPKNRTKNARHSNYGPGKPSNPL